MQAYIKHKAYYEKKADASKLTEVYYYVLLAQADHQGSKIPITEFRWIGPYNIEKVLPNNKYLVRKIHALPTPESGHKNKNDPELSLKHDDLIARAWECEYKKPIFDAKNTNATPPNSPESRIHSDLST